MDHQHPTEPAASVPGPARASAGSIVVLVLAVLVTLGYLLFSLFFLLLGWGLTDGNPSGGWWWTMIVVTLALVWHVLALVMTTLRGRPWARALLPGTAAAVVPAAMALEIFWLPAVLLMALTGVLMTLVARDG